MKSYTSLHHRYLHEYAFTSVLKLRLQLCQCFSVSRQHSSFDFRFSCWSLRIGDSHSLFHEMSYKYLRRILESDKSLYQAYKAYVQFLCKFKSILYMFQIYNLCFTKQLGFAWLALSVCYTWEHLAICQRQYLQPDTADGCPCLSLSC